MLNIAGNATGYGPPSALDQTGLFMTALAVGVNSPTLIMTSKKPRRT
jgi:hypothetical protein